MSDYESGYDPKYGYNRNAFAHITFPMVILGKTAKLIATPIGLASEALHHHRGKNRSTSTPGASVTPESPVASADSHDAPTSPDQGNNQSPIYVNVPADQAEELIANEQAVLADDKEPTHELVPQNSDEDGIERDEADWALDDAAGKTENDSKSPRQPKSTAQNEVPPVYSKANPHSTNAPKNLPYPVILPQRRPGTKARGFIRAYAPSLQDSGINQDAFLTFLKDFHQAAQASPIFDIIMIGTAIAACYPDILVGLAVQGIQIIAAAGQEVQERLRTNTFLDQANKALFMPKGLFAVIVAYKPGTDGQTEARRETVNLEAIAMARYGGSLRSQESGPDVDTGAGSEKREKVDGMEDKMKQLRISSGETRESEIPVTCAPLIFPALDAIAANSTKKNENVVKSSQKFVAEYFDRRAQAIYTAQNPNSILTKEISPISPQFTSRFADPNNATNTHFFTLITGGKFKAEPLGARRRWEKAQRRAEKQRLQGLKQKASKRILQEGVLYLMITNLPSEQEVEDARKEMREAKARTRR